MATIKKAQVGVKIKTAKKYVPTAKEKKNLDDASKNINMRPPFTPEERKKMPKVGNMGSAKSGKSIKKAKDGASFPDLNKDGKVTRADILKGRGVIAKKGASMKKCKYGCK